MYILIFVYSLMVVLNIRKVLKWTIKIKHCKHKSMTWNNMIYLCNRFLVILVFLLQITQRLMLCLKLRGITISNPFSGLFFYSSGKLHYRSRDINDDRGEIVHFNELVRIIYLHLVFVWFVAIWVYNYALLGM